MEEREGETETQREEQREREGGGVVCWLLSVPGAGLFRHIVRAVTLR